MKYSEIKEIRQFCEKLTSEPDWKEVIKNIADGESDFEVGNVRFINSDYIDEIQQEELSNDEYILGCFNACFIAGILEIDVDVIEAMQKAQAYEALGKLIISLGKIPELQAEYASSDGYGNHFNNYDGNEEELHVNGQLFHVFDNR